MKTLLSITAATLLTMSAANALNFSQVDDATGNQNLPYASQAGDGFVSPVEAQRQGISVERFNAADTNGDGKLTPTEFRNLV